MDDLARLRQKIYVERRRGIWEETMSAIEKLGGAILGDHAATDEGRAFFLAAALRHGGPDELLLRLASAAGASPYVSRYAADAVAAHPDAGSVADELLSHIGTSSDDPDRSRDFSEEHTAKLEHSVSIVQSMFYGDPTRTGRGNSGGIGTLLRDLGSYMGEEAGGVATLVLYNTAAAAYPFVPVERVSAAHSIVRMPVYLPEESAYGFLKQHQALRLAVRETMSKYDIRPQVMHVRFLDDASLAVAREAENIGAKLVVTLTPDPHRQVCEANGSFRSLRPPQAMEYLNKILIGDELVSRADGILAIGHAALGRELLPYYPQLEDTRSAIVRGIDEGVRMTPSSSSVDVPELLTADRLEHALLPKNIDRPTLLTIGRLANVKNQTALVTAWGKEAWRTHNLVVIGGDIDHPSEEEGAVIDAFRDIMRKRRELVGRFSHLPATPNEVVRKVQQYFADRSPATNFDAYVCPSRKEEFGLSVVEAMASGMLVYAPIRGGARTYIHHGINGFLLDTRDDASLTSELRSTILGGRLAPSQVDTIKENALRTVREQYSLEGIAAQFADFYRRVIGA